MAQKPGEPKILFEELTYAIIGAAMEVHRLLGPGFLETVYQAALAYEFKVRQIAFTPQVHPLVRYKDMVAGDFRADFVVEDKIVIEIKAISALTKADEAQILNYLRATGLRVGLLLNFGANSLEYRRRIL